MSYQEQLHPWAIFRRLPNLQCQLIERFRRRNDAEAFLKTLKRLQPESEFEIVYDVPREISDTIAVPSNVLQP